MRFGAFVSSAPASAGASSSPPEDGRVSSPAQNSPHDQTANLDLSKATFSPPVQNRDTSLAKEGWVFYGEGYQKEDARGYVSELQARLRTFLKEEHTKDSTINTHLSTDGKYGPKTRDAVLLFREVKGLKSNGSNPEDVDPQFVQELLKYAPDYQTHNKRPAQSSPAKITRAPIAAAEAAPTATPSPTPISTATQTTTPTPTTTTSPTPAPTSTPSLSPIPTVSPVNTAISTEPSALAQVGDFAATGSIAVGKSLVSNLAAPFQSPTAFAITAGAVGLAAASPFIATGLGVAAGAYTVWSLGSAGLSAWNANSAQERHQAAEDLGSAVGTAIPLGMIGKVGKLARESETLGNIATKAQRVASELSSSKKLAQAGERVTSAFNGARAYFRDNASAIWKGASETFQASVDRIGNVLSQSAPTLATAASAKSAAIRLDAPTSYGLNPSQRIGLVRYADGFEGLTRYVSKMQRAIDVFHNRIQGLTLGELDGKELKSILSEVHKAGQYKGDPARAGAIRGNLNKPVRPPAADYAEQIAEMYGGNNAKLSNGALYIDGISAEASPRNIFTTSTEGVRGQHEYPKTQDLDQYFHVASRHLQKALSEIMKLNETPGNGDNRIAVDEIGQFYHVMANARPFDEVNNSLAMNIVNYLLKRAGESRQAQGDLDHLMMRLDSDQARTAWRVFVRGELPTAQELGISGLK